MLILCNKRLYISHLNSRQGPAHCHSFQCVVGVAKKWIQLESQDLVVHTSWVAGELRVQVKVLLYYCISFSYNSCIVWLLILWVCPIKWPVRVWLTPPELPLSATAFVNTNPWIIGILQKASILVKGHKAATIKVRLDRNITSSFYRTPQGIC